MSTLCPQVVSLRASSSETPESSQSYIIDLWDPSRPASEQLSTIGLMMPAAPLGEEGLDIMPSGSKRPSQRAILSSEKRRASAFRNGLLEVTKRVHSDFLCQQINVAATSHDVKESGIWHPDFPLHDISLATFLSEATATALANSRSHQANRLGDFDLSGTASASASVDKGAPPRPPRQLKKVPRCHDTSDIAAHAMVKHLREGLGSLGQLAHCEHLTKRLASYGTVEHSLSDATWAALQSQGIQQLYTHQAQAINHAMAGRSVVVATATASGKSLCYNIPVMEAVQRCPQACALYLFPTKALAQDQHRAVVELFDTMDRPPTVAVYDGDTCQGDRPSIRNSAQLIITNPDMLHVSILPSHGAFARILTNLKYVVVDEGHAYRGAFGCHTALILRRLRRVCHEVYGCTPTFVVCSATVANPKEHVQELLGVSDVTAITEDGSPCGEKLFLMWNPPLVRVPIKETQKQKKKARNVQGMSMSGIPYSDSSRDAPAGIEMRRASPIVEVALLLAEMVQHNLRCIAFCGTRKLCELVLCYTRETLRETAPQLVNAVMSYRGGYTAKDRRCIEGGLFGGTLRGVAATNALELGVDVGSLDATIHLGFQGTVASMWQQAGRAGRRENASLSVYVAFESPLDQYFMRAPHKLFSRAIESAQVDSQNCEVLRQHLACAAFELPLLTQHAEKYFGAATGAGVAELVEKGELGRHPTNGHVDQSWHYIGHCKSPSQSIGIRAIDPDKYAVLDERTNEVVEEIEASKAFFVVYEGAVYMHQGRNYLVKSLSVSRRQARCVPADLKYYTHTVDMTDVFVLGGNLVYHGKVGPPSTRAQCSPCRVTTHWMGFRRVWQGSNAAFDFVPLFLPDVTFHSQAVWISVPSAVRPLVEADGIPFRASLHAACHALVNVLPLYVMCSSADVASECAHPADTRFHPDRLLIYDRHPGGIGIVLQARPMFAELLNAALELISSCDCLSESGCPSCVQTLKCSQYNEVLHKKGAQMILQRLIEAEAVYREGLL